MSKKLIKKFSKDYILKYLTQMNLRKISVEGKKKISNSMIIIIGLGGIGTPFLTYIIRDNQIKDSLTSYIIFFRSINLILWLIALIKSW